MPHGFLQLGLPLSIGCGCGPAWCWIALTLVAILCGVAALRAPRITWVPLAIMWCMLGAWCALMEPHPAPRAGACFAFRRAASHCRGNSRGCGDRAHGDGASLNDDAPAAQDPAPELKQRIDLRVSSLETVTDTEDAQTPVSGGVRLIVRWPEGTATQNEAAAFQCGERVRANVRLLPPETYHDPGAWSREDFLVGQGVTSTGGVAIDSIESLGQTGSAGTLLACRLSGLQHATTSRLLALPAAMHRLPAPCDLLKTTPSC